MQKSYLVYIADVFCPWCYGFAPIMARLAAENQDLPVHVIGGNLISQPITLAEDAASQPGMVDFWRQVEQKTGRSLEGAIRAVETGANVRLYSPGADEILTALYELVPGRELDQLFELEDMFYGQGLDLFTDQNLASIAGHWQINPSAFLRVLDQKATYEATERNLEEASELMGEISSYPSVLLVRGRKIDAVSRGYVHYETVASRLQHARKDLGLEEAAPVFHSRHRSCTLHRCD